MKCSVCGEEVSQEMRFCSGCGAEVKRATPIGYCCQCGTELKEYERFCTSCGIEQIASIEPQVTTLGERLAVLFDLSLQNPYEALEELKPCQEMLDEQGESDYWGIQIVYFNAYGTLAHHSLKDKSTSNDKMESARLSELALKAFDKAVRNAVYEEVQRHTEKVIVRPAGLFRKEEVAYGERSTTTKKSKIDIQLFEQDVDYLAILLEMAAPGRASAILGYAKPVWFNSIAGRLNYAQSTKTWVQDDEFFSRWIGNVHFEVKEPAKCVAIIGGAGALHIRAFSTEEPDPDHDVGGFSLINEQFIQTGTGWKVMN